MPVVMSLPVRVCSLWLILGSLSFTSTDPNMPLVILLTSANLVLEQLLKVTLSYSIDDLLLCNGFWLCKWTAAAVLPGAYSEYSNALCLLHLQFLTDCFCLLIQSSSYLGNNLRRLTCGEMGKHVFEVQGGVFRSNCLKGEEKRYRFQFSLRFGEGIYLGFCKTDSQLRMQG